MRSLKRMLKRPDWTRISLHVVFWSALAGLMYLSLGAEYSATEIRYFLFQWLSIMAALIYFNNYYLVPKFLFQKKTLAYLGALAILIFVFSYLAFHILLLKPEGTFPHFLYLIPNLLPLVVLATGLRYYRWSGIQAKEIEDLELKKQLSELAVLKAQVNPHFLFNTLNHIYAQAIKEEAPETSDAIVQLSSLMRYMLSAGKSNIVALDAEMSYIQNYITLKKRRLGDRVNVELNKEGDFSDIWLPPFLFIPFIENIFKHGYFPTNETTVIKIEFVRNQEKVIFTCANTYKDKKGESTRVGLENIKKRLVLHFPKKHELIIKTQSNIFDVRLTISL